MLLKRVISSLILAGVLFATLLLGNSNILFYLIVVNALVGIGMYEVLNMVEKKGVPVFKLYVIVSGIVLTSTVFFSVHKRVLTGDLLTWVMLVLFCGLFLLYARRKDLSGSILGFFSSIGTIMYVSWFFSFLVRINYLEGVDGRMYILFVFFTVFFADIVAFFVGSNLGRRPLAPVISPKKTVEGGAGAVIGAVMGAAVSKFLFVGGLPWKHTIILGILVGFISQVGDLFESILKRDAGVKDSGHLLPGLGGVMDLIDGLLFCSPFIYLYLKIFVR